MKPLGQKPSRFPCKEDVHPKKGYVNWWENEITPGSKAEDKRNAKKEIEKESLNWKEEKKYEKK